MCMRGVEFRALLRFEENGLWEVGRMTAVKPGELVDHIRRRRDEGEIEVPEDAEVWVVPAGSFMRRTAVPTKYESTEGGDWTVAFATEEDRDYGETYLALSRMAEGEFRVDGAVRAIKPESAARVAAALKGEGMSAREVVLVPEQTVNSFGLG